MARDDLVIDETHRIGRNDVRITQDSEGRWLLSKYPLSPDDPGYPGFTYSPTNGGCPDGPDVDSMLAWAKAQPWSQPSAE
jgi:hypothetical protein